MIVGNLLTIAIVLRLHETERKPGGRFLPLLLRECQFPLCAIEPLARYCYSMLLCERQTDRDMLFGQGGPPLHMPSLLWQDHPVVHRHFPVRQKSLPVTPGIARSELIVKLRGGVFQPQEVRARTLDTPGQEDTAPQHA